MSPASGEVLSLGGLHSRGVSTPDATPLVYGQLYGSIQRQAAALSYVDTFWTLSVICFAIAPIVFIAKRPAPGQAVAAH